jgi:DNA polymerase III alpha subunit
MVLPIFRSNYSLTSILTLDKASPAEDRKKNRADSVFDICKDNELQDVFIADNNLSGLVEAYENSQSASLNLRYGFRVNVCNNIEDKSPESVKTEGKLILFAKDESFKDLIKLHNIATTAGIHDGRPRLDYSTIKTHWTKNLLMVIPFYDSFIFNNLLYGHECIPDIDFAKPYICIEENGLPFDNLVKNQIMSSIKYDQLESKTVYYNKRTDFNAYMTYRCILNRTNFQKPELSHFGSTEFCMEAINNAR